MITSEIHDKGSEGLKLLKDVKHITYQIEVLQEQIDEVYTQLTKTTVKPKEINVTTSTPADPMADRIITMLEYQKQIEEYQVELYKKKVKVITLLKSMEIEEQRILILRYFKSCTVEDIADKIGYTYRWAWEKLHQAESNFIDLYSKTT